ncbi:NAD(P)/FAD-dependent oxidoreductase [Streptomyces sp. BH055]|uniref:NAD(P)/FAD-dependent oxidoreductase n=1 Tax=Streptomyces sp. BH055 TaxID=3401173 RepID=UPI003BB6F214
MTYDVVVVGGGPAGLAGAVVLGRALCSVLVVDAGEPRNARAARVHNVLTRDGVGPSELLAAGRADAKQYGVEFRSGTVSRITGALPEFHVELADGTAVQARRVLVATGLADVLPEISGLAERWGESVHHCAHCHGYEVRGRAVGLLGDSLAVVMNTLLWRQWSEDLVLFLNDSVHLDAAQHQQLDARGVRVMGGRVRAFSEEGVELADGTVVPRDCLALHTRVEARADFLAPLGLLPAELPMGLGTHLPVGDPTGRTGVPGVFVAGNACDAWAQVASSAAAGVTAGEALTMDLVMAESA